MRKLAVIFIFLLLVSSAGVLAQENIFEKIIKSLFGEGEPGPIIELETPPMFAPPMVFDHNSLEEFDLITQQEADDVHATNFLFGHQSVGRNIMDGLNALEGQDSKYSTNIIPSDFYLDVTRQQYLDYGSIFGQQNSGSNGNPSSKNAEFFGFLNSNDDLVNVAFLKYCYVDVTNTIPAQQVFDNYKVAVDLFEASHPDVTLVHFTNPITPSPSDTLNNVQRNIYRDLILQEYGNIGYVFDLADLESWYNGAYTTFDYGGNTYLRMNDAYSLDGQGHLNSVGGQMVAKALWVMMKELATGGGPSPEYPQISNIECDLRGGFVTCDNAHFEDTLESLRVTCTDTDGTIQSAHFTLTNVEDSNQFFDLPATQNGDNWELLEINQEIIDSGTFNVFAECTDNDDQSSDLTESFFIAWGIMNIEVVSVE